MASSIIERVKQRIKAKHQDDERQLEVVFSSSNKLLVEAPAGYGKTNTMVSKIAYMIATGQIPNPKKLLALTFSVNAAYKIKKDVTQQIPALLAETGLNVNPADKIFVSNYHGFCRSVLKKYGYAFHSNLMSIDALQSVDDASIEGVQRAYNGVSFEDAEFLSNYSDALKKNDNDYLSSNFEKYCDIVITELLPNRIISYNGILTLVIKLLRDFPEVSQFYQKYYTTILVDEYQDTNSLSYQLLKHLIADSTKVILLGDSLQRIYGFIGAVPNLLSISRDEFDLTKIQLSKNYRFASNPQMLQLDSNIRRNAENPRNPNISTNAKMDLNVYKNQEEEAEAVVKKCTSLTTGESPGKVAVLVKQRGGNINRVLEEFNKKGISFFFGLFTDEQSEYVQFHRKSLFEFIDLIKVKDQITKKLSREHLKKMHELYRDDESALINALVDLLSIFWERIFTDFSSFSNEEKIILIKDTFEYNGLKQYIEFVNSNVIISTVHGAKGLEWDYVILPDMEQDSFPSWPSLCGQCLHKSNCELEITDQNEERFLEDLSVFYVAVTRARKQVYFTASKKNIDNYGNERSKNLSCLLRLKGLEI